jgi:predicted membrane protein
MSGKTVIFGLILILIGLMFFGQTTGMYFVSLNLVLPIVLIFVGIWLIVRKKKQIDQVRVQTVMDDFVAGTRPSSTDTAGTTGPDAESFAEKQASSGISSGPYQTSPRLAETPSRDPRGGLKYSKTLGDMYIDCKGISLENIEVSSFLGDIEVKLHGGTLSRGLNRIVISEFIGDARVYLPKGMAFFTQCSNFIGDIDLEDKRTSGFSNNVEMRSEDYESAESKVYIAINSFLGDIRVRVM